MPRRGKVIKRQVAPDPKYGSFLIAKFVNKMMIQGRKATAERIVYDALDLINQKLQTDPVGVFDQAIKNATPAIEVRSRRVGGATYQVPVETRSNRGLHLAMRWLVNYARARSGKSMAEKLAAELIDSAQGQGATIKKRQDTHRMAEANKAFVHYRW